MSQEDELRGTGESHGLYACPQRVVRSCQYLLFCYPAIREWNVSIGVVDRILLNFQRTTGLFGSILWTKAFLRYLPCPVVSGHEGCKGGKNQMGAYLGSPFRRCCPLLFQLVAAQPAVPLMARTAFYILTLAVGYLCLLAAGVWISRLLKQDLMDDVFNNENESFMQETRLIENEYSVNLPTRFYYGKKWNNGWINVVNPFRASIVLGTPGSGKSFAVVNSYIKQQIEKGYAAYIYDFKFPDLSTIAYNHLLNHLEGYKVPPKFYVINFDDPSRSHRCNAPQPRSS